jgi:hypothetical protein
MNKIIFDVTPYNTIRVWVYFEKNENENQEFNNFLKSPMGEFFGFVNCWGGYDKREIGLVSWELPLSLASFIIEKFHFVADVSILEILF